MAITEMVSRDETKRVRYARLAAQLKNERASFEPDWRECNDWILSRRARFFVSDTNRGGRRNQRIIDSSGTLAARTLRSGMMAGITSPSREWKRLTTDDPEMAEYGRVKVWLNTVNDRMSNRFRRSNLYNVLPLTYGDMGVFGTSGIFVEEDFEKGSRYYSLPIGSYWIANDDKLQVRVMMREYPMTVRQIVMKFGKENVESGKPAWSNISNYVKRMWDKGQYETWVDVGHFIHPNEDKDYARKLNGKPFVSCYYELGTADNRASNYLRSTDDDVYLRESGYNYFPGLFPRWEVTGGDVYATSCPGFDALGDIKQLQHGEKKSAKGLDKLVDPAMVGPTSMQNQKASILPGDMNYTDEREGTKGFRPVHEVNIQFDKLEMKQQQIRMRIQSAFFADLFLMLSQSDRRDITAREIDERHEEKLIALGPVLEQTNQDLLDPLIDLEFDFMMRQGEVPPPPPELEGMPLKVEYISIMAQAQKLAGIANMERFGGMVGQLATITGSFPRKINVDQFIDVYGDRLSIDPTIIRSDEEVAEMEAQDKKAQMAAMAAENAKNAAGAAKDLSQAGLEEDSALKRLLEQGQAGQLVRQ